MPHTQGEGARAQLTTSSSYYSSPFSLLIALAVDLGGALAYRTWQGSSESTRQSCFGEANAVEYAENPGEEARSEVLEMLKANGYPEKPRSIMSRHRRPCVERQTDMPAST